MFINMSAVFLILANLLLFGGYILSNLEPVISFTAPGISLMVAGAALMWWLFHSNGYLEGGIGGRLRHNPRVPRLRFVLGRGISFGFPGFIVTVFLIAIPDLAQGDVPDLRVVSSAGAAIGSVIFSLTSWSAWKMHREIVECPGCRIMAAEQEYRSWRVFPVTDIEGRVTWQGILPPTGQRIWSIPALLFGSKRKNVALELHLRPRPGSGQSGAMPYMVLWRSEMKTERFPGNSEGRIPDSVRACFPPQAAFVRHLRIFPGIRSRIAAHRIRVFACHGLYTGLFCTVSMCSSKVASWGGSGLGFRMSIRLNVWSSCRASMEKFLFRIC